MAVTIIDKQEDMIFTTEDGKTSGRSVRLTDCVISAPPEGFKKITNIYIEQVSGKLVVIYEE